MASRREWSPQAQTPPKLSIEEKWHEQGEAFKREAALRGEEAVTLLRGNKGKYQALVADIALRGRMSGWEVATKAREIDPEFPVVYLTCAYAHQWAFRGVANSVLLTKPFAPPQLVTGISQLLNTGGPPIAPAG